MILPAGVRGLDAATRNREREWGMAKNIADRIFAREPQARVVVWTGEQHAMRMTPPGWQVDYGPYMATHLGELLDEAPFCVGQEVVDWPELSGSPRLLASDHSWLQERGLDTMVLHHRGPAPARPAWLKDHASACHVRVEGAELVQAMPACEGERSVPAGQALAHGAAELSLLLPPGDYVLQGLRGHDEVVWRRSFRHLDAEKAGRSRDA